MGAPCENLNELMLQDGNSELKGKSIACCHNNETKTYNNEP